MTWNDILKAGVELILMIASIITTTYIAPYLKAKKKALEQEAESKGWADVLSKLEDWAAGLEQIAIKKGYSGEWKMEKLTKYAEEELGLEITSSMKTLLEGIVIELHKSLYGEVSGGEK